MSGGVQPTWSGTPTIIGGWRPHGSLILAYGRDPYFAGWPDTFQLNYRHPGFREAMARELLKLAGIADGVRCDMAMLILPEIFQRTWGDRSLPTDGSPLGRNFSGRRPSRG